MFTKDEQQAIQSILAVAGTLGIAPGEASALGGQAIIDAELEQGRKLLRVGAGPIWVRPSDWRADPSPIITYDDKECRIIAVWAAKERSGALRRLVRAIEKSGRKPVVVEPIGHAMPAIMEQWKWVETKGTDGESEWRPVG